MNVANDDNDVRLRVHRKLLDRLYAVPAEPPAPANQVHYEMLGVIVALCTDGELLEQVFPYGKGTVNADPLFAVDTGIIDANDTRDRVTRLLQYREAFASVARAWMDASPYEVPPCPSRGRLRKIMELMYTLKDVE